MQTDILLKQLRSSLSELKIAVEKFEKHPSPSTQYTEQLHLAIHQSNKMVSAYLVLKEQNDVSPELNMHVKLMNASVSEEPPNVKNDVVEQVIVETVITENIIEEVVEETIEVIDQVAVEEISVINEQPEIKSVEKQYPKVAISINDKFRFINELFASNASEYNIAIEQLNNISSVEDLNNYIKGLKSIYEWKDDSEVVKNFYNIALKRFS
jgi:hypothetical protein